MNFFGSRKELPKRHVKQSDSRSTHHFFRVASCNLGGWLPEPVGEEPLKAPFSHNLYEAIENLILQILIANLIHQGSNLINLD